MASGISKRTPEQILADFRTANAAELLVIADRAAAGLKRPYVDHAELLYDENGLPK